MGDTCAIYFPRPAFTLAHRGRRRPVGHSFSKNKSRRATGIRAMKQSKRDTAPRNVRHYRDNAASCSTAGWQGRCKQHAVYPLLLPFYFHCGTCGRREISTFRPCTPCLDSTLARKFLSLPPGRAPLAGGSGPETKLNVRFLGRV